MLVVAPDRRRDTHPIPNHPETGIVPVELSRNFGKEALAAGLEAASAAVIVMDGDLQTRRASSLSWCDDGAAAPVVNAVKSDRGVKLRSTSSRRSCSTCSLARRWVGAWNRSLTQAVGSAGRGAIRGFRNSNAFPGPGRLVGFRVDDIRFGCTNVVAPASVRCGCASSEPDGLFFRPASGHRLAWRYRRRSRDPRRGRPVYNWASGRAIDGFTTAILVTSSWEASTSPASESSPVPIHVRRAEGAACFIVRKHRSIRSSRSMRWSGANRWGPNEGPCGEARSPRRPRRTRRSGLCISSTRIRSPLTSPVDRDWFALREVVIYRRRLVSHADRVLSSVPVLSLSAVRAVLVLRSGSCRR